VLWRVIKSPNKRGKAIKKGKQKNTESKREKEPIGGNLSSPPAAENPSLWAPRGAPYPPCSRNNTPVWFRFLC
jgi:hypothetical protein